MMASDEHTPAPPDTQVPDVQAAPEPMEQDPLDSPTEQGRGEYETGRVICEICGEGISFRDEATGGFTLNHWEAHRSVCVAVNQITLDPPGAAPIRLPPTHPSSLASTSSVMALGPNSSLVTTQILPVPSKRRRAKRSEEERISYLRNDPHVAQFEAYRVLCGNCNKWIRLRPNSTYCSIPWDAHRKSCLARKGPGARRSKKPKSESSTAPPDPRVAYFAKDPEVRRYEGDRVLCNMCARWVSLTSDKDEDEEEKEGEDGEDEEEEEEEEDLDDAVVKRWLKHRTACRADPDRRAEGAEDVGKPGSAESEAQPHENENDAASQAGSPAASFESATPAPGNDPASSPSAKQGAGRRMNAEQRAAVLRADPLIGRVEPNRVFCTLCEKWVQLRQDSTYCAYPWTMHRGKCLRRRERRVQKAAEAAEVKAQQEELRRQRMEARMAAAAAGEAQGEEEEEDEGKGEKAVGDDELEDPESEEGVDSEDEAERERRREERKRALAEKKKVKKRRRGRPRKDEQREGLGAVMSGVNGAGAAAVNGHGLAGAGMNIQVWKLGTAVPGTTFIHENEIGGVEEDEEDEEDELDEDEPGEGDRKRRKIDAGPRLADLDSPEGRASFIHASVDYLLHTTYEATDELTIPVLVDYLNAAMPRDKHEDFDRTEVAKALAVEEGSEVIRPCGPGYVNGNSNGH
ncbi:hypothetical protein GLOTRDRAFT_120748 [Gloeophyllum trabeum ATCC 11539]|uniref:Uncharacterized protein n=1 Tax=Gloeophyllum trabeum (strain ATCC 11539 / FP-39264 / Madison 617) TaxID=670483 RepID=S7Q7X6_GLOTA|nr:uncharacterized protein GLOTRDRAFT_120748 [Gloeophyllum trabeum ATCC 11539]EPQ56086.1 hypothetical protein GLOTRDRAFT_120748 [Gloeophyllum trabeum ATCC 11539]